MDFKTAKKCFEEERKVRHTGSQSVYTFSQLVFRHDGKGNILTEGGLLDKDANSIVFVNIRRIEEV